MMTILVKGRLNDENIREMDGKLRHIVKGFKEIVSSHASTGVVVEKDVWIVVEMISKEGCEIESIHDWSRKIANHITF
ncbi:MAG: hypothetical protein ACXQTD_09340 [Candidatus Syntropharchaeia archaeon]